MTEKEMLKISIEEFDRIQDYMLCCEKDTEVYKKMKKRYTALKVILTASGVNLTALSLIADFRQSNMPVNRPPPAHCWWSTPDVFLPFHHFPDIHRKW